MEKKSPVLLILFNRPESSRQVFEKIRKYKPDRLYIAADGPRPGIVSDVENCNEVRKLAVQVDWNCQLKTLFQDENLGMPIAVPKAIGWFFDQEEEGIILEDDCLPADSFFRFCHILLERYRNEDRVMHIGGANLQMGRRRGHASYYFSGMANIWGWAGWRRVWQKIYDPEMQTWPEFEKQDLMINVFPDRRTAEFASGLARAVYEKKLMTWDYPLGYAIIINNGLCITPNSNLVSNIGFSVKGTTSKNADDVHANIPTEEITEITHPEFFVANRQADLFQFSLSMPKNPGQVERLTFAERIAGRASRFLGKKQLRQTNS